MFAGWIRVCVLVFPGVACCGFAVIMVAVILGGLGLYLVVGLGWFVLGLELLGGLASLVFLGLVIWAVALTGWWMRCGGLCLFGICYFVEFFVDCCNIGLGCGWFMVAGCEVGTLRFLSCVCGLTSGWV